MSNEQQPLDLDHILAELYKLKKARDAEPKLVVITTLVSSDEMLLKPEGKFLDEPRYSGYVKIETMPDGTQRRGEAVYYKHEAVLPVI